MTIGGIRAALAAFIGALALTGCGARDPLGRPAVAVTRADRALYAIDPQALDRSAERVHREALLAWPGEPELEQAARIRRVASRLMRVVGAVSPDAARWHWQVDVIAADAPLAWCLPGGRLGVSAGLAAGLAPDDHALAALLAHQIAHALRGHLAERVQSMRMRAAVAASPSSPARNETPSALDEWLRAAAFEQVWGQVHETEADRIGVELAARAGFDPGGALTAAVRQAAAGDAAPAWQRRHPGDRDRLTDLTTWVERVRPLQDAASPVR